MPKNEIWVFVEHHLNLVSPVTNELITKAKSIANGKNVVAILFEQKKQTLEHELQAYGPDEILIMRDDNFKEAPDSLYATLLAELAVRRNPNTILFGATVLGRSISARLQAKLLTGLTADCLDLSFEDDLLIQTKPSYGDNIMCEIVCPNTRPQMATVRPNIFMKKKEVNPNLVITEVKDIKIPRINNIKVNEEKPLLSKGESIANADRVVAIGRGMMSKDKDASLTKDLAYRLGAKIGVTRPLTDNGIFSAEDQIGQSGNTIAPRLLLTLGVHGAVQFVSGITKSEVVVAVNTNHEAPIFSYADYTFVGDAYEFVEAFLKVLQ